MYWTGNTVGPALSIDVKSCVGTGGAACPTFVKDTSVFSFGEVWSGQVGAFPVGATLTITYTATFTFTSCGTGTVTNETTIRTPAGIDNTAGDRSRAQVNGVLDGGDCAQADVGVTMSQSAVAENDQVPTVYTVIYTNNGPSAANGSSIKAQAFWSESTITRMKATILSCATTGGAVCPPLADSTVFSFASLFDRPVATYPSGSSITVKYTLVPVISTCGPAANVTSVYETSTPVGMTIPSNRTTEPSPRPRSPARTFPSTNSFPARCSRQRACELQHYLDELQSEYSQIHPVLGPAAFWLHLRFDHLRRLDRFRVRPGLV